MRDGFMEDEDVKEKVLFVLNRKEVFEKSNVS